MRFKLLLALLLAVPASQLAAQTLVQGGPTAGSDYLISRYNSSGSLVDTPFKIGQSTGAITLGGPLNLNASGSTGDISGMSVTATGATASRSLAASIADSLNVISCGAKFDGTTDDTAAINACITAKANAGGGIVLLPPGTAVISTIVPKSGVWLLGSGQRSTFLKCTANCVVQDSSTALNAFTMSDINFQPSGGATGVTVMTFSAIQVSEITRILAEGFTTGTIMSLGGTKATTTPDSNLGSNVIFNDFHNITAFGCATCVTISGHYGSTPTASPANSANQPDQVVTQNKFDNINLYYVTGTCWDIVRAADTNVWNGGLCNASANTGVIAVAQGDDSSYTGNTYVNSNKFFGFAISKQSNVTGMTFFYSQNYNFALEAYGFETDIDTSAAGIVPVNLGTSANAPSYRICGKRLDTNASISNVNLGCQTRGVAWTLLNNAAPSTGFVIAVPPGTSSYGITGSGTLATGQLQMPCGAPDGQVVSLWSSGLTVTSLTVASCSGAGSSIAGSNGTLSPTSPMQFRYIAASNFWVRN
jgi:hypothetical protein